MWALRSRSDGRTADHGRFGGVQTRMQKTDSNAVVVPNEVLMIRQTRTAHEAIGKLIQDLTSSSRVDSSATVAPPVSRSLPFGSNLIQKSGK